VLRDPLTLLPRRALLLRRPAALGSDPPADLPADTLPVLVPVRLDARLAAGVAGGFGAAFFGLAAAGAAGETSELSISIAAPQFLQRTLLPWKVGGSL